MTISTAGYAKRRTWATFFISVAIILMTLSACDCQAGPSAPGPGTRGVRAKPALMAASTDCFSSCCHGPAASSITYAVPRWPSS